MIKKLLFVIMPLGLMVVGCSGGGDSTANAAPATPPPAKGVKKPMQSGAAAKPMSAQGMQAGGGNSGIGTKG